MHAMTGGPLQNWIRWTCIQADFSKLCWAKKTPFSAPATRPSCRISERLGHQGSHLKGKLRVSTVLSSYESEFVLLSSGTNFLLGNRPAQENQVTVFAKWPFHELRVGGVGHRGFSSLLLLRKSLAPPVAHDAMFTSTAVDLSFFIVYTKQSSQASACPCPHSHWLPKDMQKCVRVCMIPSFADPPLEAELSPRGPPLPRVPFVCRTTSPCLSSKHPPLLMPEPATLTTLEARASKGGCQQQTTEHAVSVVALYMHVEPTSRGETSPAEAFSSGQVIQSETFTLIFALRQRHDPGLCLSWDTFWTQRPFTSQTKWVSEYSNSRAAWPQLKDTFSPIHYFCSGGGFPCILVHIPVHCIFPIIQPRYVRDHTTSKRILGKVYQHCAKQRLAALVKLSNEGLIVFTFRGNAHSASSSKQVLPEF